MFFPVYRGRLSSVLWSKTALDVSYVVGYQILKPSKIKLNRNQGIVMGRLWTASALVVVACVLGHSQAQAKRHRTGPSSAVPPSAAPDK